MPFESLYISRNELQEFLPNPRTIKQFENLFKTANGSVTVDSSTVSDGDFLQWDATASDWVAMAPEALTKTDDTNVTLTFGGTPASALLDAVSITVGWTGELSIARGGTGAADASTALSNLGGAPLTRVLTAGDGLTGGGDLSADRTFDVGAGTGITVNTDDVALDTSSTRNTDHAAVTITAGTGLSGGGDITANRTINLDAAASDLTNGTTGSGQIVLETSPALETPVIGPAYTVATLPAAGTAGRRAYVTDASGPTFLSTLTGGGAVVCPVFDDGTNWVAG